MSDLTLFRVPSRAICLLRPPSRMIFTGPPPEPKTRVGRRRVESHKKGAPARTKYLKSLSFLVVLLSWCWEKDSNLRRPEPRVLQTRAFEPLRYPSDSLILHDIQCEYQPLITPTTLISQTPICTTIAAVPSLVGRQLRIAIWTNRSQIIQTVVFGITINMINH